MRRLAVLLADVRSERLRICKRMDKSAEADNNGQHDFSNQERTVLEYGDDLRLFGVELKILLQHDGRCSHEILRSVEQTQITESENTHCQIDQFFQFGFR